MPTFWLDKVLYNHIYNIYINCQNSLDHGESKRIPEKHLLLLH